MPRPSWPSSGGRTAPRGHSKGSSRRLKMRCQSLDNHGRWVRGSIKTSSRRQRRRLRNGCLMPVSSSTRAPLRQSSHAQGLHIRKSMASHAIPGTQSLLLADRRVVPVPRLPPARPRSQVARISEGQSGYPPPSTASWALRRPMAECLASHLADSTCIGTTVGSHAPSKTCGSIRT